MSQSSTHHKNSIKSKLVRLPFPIPPKVTIYSIGQWSHKHGQRATLNIARIMQCTRAMILECRIAVARATTLR